MLGRFAKEFGIHPDEVFRSTRFDTFAEFAVGWKEEAEYDERFLSIWENVNK
jgi:hypothetical protein